MDKERSNNILALAFLFDKKARSLLKFAIDDFFMMYYLIFVI
jgi:hypothetical protein